MLPLLLCHMPYHKYILSTFDFKVVTHWIFKLFKLKYNIKFNLNQIIIYKSEVKY